MELVKTFALELQKMPSWAKNVLIISGATLILSLFANVSFHLPFTPVPVATQPAIVLLMAVLLGPKRAVAAVAAFLAQGACGLPVFAGGLGGMTHLVGVTGGYLFGYLVAAFVVAKLVESFKERTLLNAFFAILIGELIIFTIGVTWLATFIGLVPALLKGFLPFLIGEAVKIIGSLKLLQWMGWGKKVEERS